MKLPRRILRPYRHAVLLFFFTGCVSPHRLSTNCTLAPTSAAWTTTANAGRVEGEVRDLKEKTPIGNLEIRLVDLDRRQRTDGRGTFRFDSVPEGSHVLVTEGSVYRPRSDTLVVRSDGGVRGTLGLATHRDVLARCPLYRP